MSRLTVSDLLDAAAEVTVHRREAITGSDRHRPVLRVRQAVYYLARSQGHSYPHIAQRMNRDHSTVHYGAGRAVEVLRRQPAFAGLVVDIERRAQVIQQRRRERHEAAYGTLVAA